ncbi:MAG: hypothetical protein U9P79_02540 [Candidatus Cloacimonadota bacterium]|nr:hypothetical protein [Candidatus Cloacimonadota bacterium]
MNKKQFKYLDIIIFIAILGSIWGLSEVVFSHLLRIAGIPYRSGILIGIGAGILGVAYAYLKKPLLFIGIVFVTILSKQLVVPLLQISVMCKANSCLAVLLIGASLAIITLLVKPEHNKRPLGRIFTGATAGATTAISFYFLGKILAPCQNLLAYTHLSGFISYLIDKGISWILFPGFLFPLGYLVGSRLKNRDISFLTEKPLLYYASTCSFVVFCWIIIAFVTVYGF